MIGAKKVVVWIWKLINMNGLCKGIFACCGFTCGGLETSEWKKQGIFFFFLGF
jgi:hypothetical protein